MPLIIILAMARYFIFGFGLLASHYFYGDGPGEIQCYLVYFHILIIFLAVYFSGFPVVVVVGVSTS